MVSRSEKNVRSVTIRQCAAFHIRYRPGHFNLIPRGGRLFQQYLVDTQVKAEADGLCYVRDHQDGFNGFRAETICCVRDTLGDGEDLDWADDRHVVLPVSVTGSPPVAPPLTGGGGILVQVVHQTHLPRNSDFFSDFGHFILKILKKSRVFG